MKRGVWIAIILGISIIFLAGTFAQSVLDETNGLSKEVTDYVKAFVADEEINSSQINNITLVDTNNLPEEIEINKVEPNKIAIYEVNYTDVNSNESKKVFVVTYSTDSLNKKEQNIVKNIQNWIFGYPEETNSSDYLYTSAGVKSNKEVGYVMMHPGSITGISTSLEITQGTGKVYIKVYKNGEDTGFNNVISSEDPRKIDYDVQSENSLTFYQGDLITTYIENPDNITFKNAVVTLETTI
ncbi:MAG: hypothetical protein WC796_03490 [Candidatus Pacearchaeota archaeon]|jgi:hypothetical protein